MSTNATRLHTALRAIATALSNQKISWALIGGFAVSARTEPRFTRDLDLAVAASDDRHAEKIVARLVQSGYRALAVIEQQEAKRLATVRLVSPAEGATGLVVDLLFASSGIEREIVAASEQIEIFEDLVIPVATTAHLIALKLLARDDVRRPQDGMDLRALLSVAGPKDLEVVKGSIAAIRSRGFERDKNLEAELARALVEFRS